MSWHLLQLEPSALRRAAGNPIGRVALEIPPIDRLEEIPDPKELLHRLLLDASEQKGGRRQNLKPAQMELRLGELIEDYSRLWRLIAFRHAEDALVSALADWP